VCHKQTGNEIKQHKRLNLRLVYSLLCNIYIDILCGVMYIKCIVNCWPVSLYHDIHNLLWTGFSGTRGFVVGGFVVGDFSTPLYSTCCSFASAWWPYAHNKPTPCRLYLIKLDTCHSLLTECSEAWSGEHWTWQVCNEMRWLLRKQARCHYFIFVLKITKQASKQRNALQRNSFIRRFSSGRVR